jgi:hypothetical protein
MEFIKDLWRGDVKLVFTFWVIGFVGNVLFAVYDPYFEYIGFYRVMTDEKAVIIFVFIIISILYRLFSTVCVWRSATKYEGRQVWAILAKMYVVLGVLGAIVEIVKAFGTT